MELTWILISWIGIGITALMIYLIYPIFSLTPKKIADKIGGSELHIYYINYVLWEFLGVVLILILLNLYNLPLTSIGFNGSLTYTNILLSLLFVLISIMLFPTILFLLKRIGVKMYWKPRQFDHFATKKRLISISLMLVICFPILEEIIFRGFIFYILFEHTTSIILVFVISGLIFASIHMLGGLGLSIYIFIGSFMISWLYFITGSIYPCIFMHSINNLIGQVIIPYWEYKRTNYVDFSQN